MVALRNSEMDSSTSKMWGMAKLCIKKGFHFVKVLINFRQSADQFLGETNIGTSRGQGARLNPSFTHFSSVNALPLSYCASESVLPFGFCRYNYIICGNLDI